MNYGFAGDELSVKVLILYALDKLRTANEDDLQRFAHIDENTDYFLFTSAIAQLVESKLMQAADGVYRLTDSGHISLEAMMKEIPAALRDECDKLAAEMLERREIENALTVEIMELDGKHRVRLQMRDGSETLLSLSMAVGDSKQAKRVARKFRENPSRVYQRVLEMLDK